MDRSFRSRAGVRAILVASTCTFVCVGIAQAQVVPCNAPPPTPGNAAASVVVAGAPTKPAIVNISWAGVPTSGANAAVTYIVEVGNAPGVTNIAQFDARGTAVSTLQPANNGTYYVRVRSANACGRSAPSPEPVVTVAGGMPAGQPSAAVTRGVYGEAEDGTVAVAGEVVGSWGSRAVAFVKIEGNFLGSAGQPVGTDFTYAYGRSRRLVASRVVDDSTLGAGESGCFLMFTDTPMAMVSSVFVTTSWDSSQLETLRGNVVVNDVQQDADASNDLVVRGQLRNAGTVTTHSNEVFIEVRDAENLVINCDYEYALGTLIMLPSGEIVASLAPGQLGQFVNFSGMPTSAVGRVNTWAAWDEVDAGPTTPTSLPFGWKRLVSGSREPAATDREGRGRLRNSAIERLRQLLTNP